MPKITKTAVDAMAIDPKKDVMLWDTELPGFGVRLQPSGRKTYVVRYRALGGQQRKMKLARTCDLSPDKARDLARKVFADVAAGEDPAAARRGGRGGPTLEAMFQGYVDHMRARGRVSATEVERMLLLAPGCAAEVLGRDREPASVTPADVVGYVSTYFQAGHRGAADKARSYVASAFSWGIKSANDYTVAERQDWGVRSNPAAEVAKDPDAKHARDRALDAAELAEVWQAATDGVGGFSLEMEVLIKAMICCGQRVNETLRMEGSEIDFKQALWVIPAEKTKGRKFAHLVPLPRQIIPLLERLVAKHGPGPLFVTAGADEVIQLSSVSQCVRRWLASGDTSMPAWQPRDLRRTWKSRTHDAGVDRFTRDLIQQHAKNDTGSKHYDRADYLEQKRAAMKKWADWLDREVFKKPPLALVA